MAVYYLSLLVACVTATHAHTQIIYIGLSITSTPYIHVHTYMYIHGHLVLYCSSFGWGGAVKLRLNTASLVCILPISAGRMWTDLHS